MKIKLTKLIAYSLIAGAFMACNSNEDTLKIESGKDSTKAVINVSEKTITNLIQSIPSPIEMASIIKGSGAEFNEKILNPSENYKKYGTSMDKAINIGIYSADLGYINIYEKSLSSIDYLHSIKSLSNDIQVGQFFDFETLNKLASNSKNMDSVLFISTSCFNKMDRFLREHKRNELSILIITGAWVEGLYITSEIAKNNKTNDLIENIGSQKINIENLNVILDLYKGNPYFKNLGEHFSELKKVYDGITITYEYKEPITKEVNGELVIEDNTTSKIVVTDAQQKIIREVITKLRKEIISL
ncbi:MAG: hypothetical protein HY840_16075 [Bacteroidetes bacterium]|nr:hypothetical protein [Bacteroidota bacterium]